MIPTQSNITKGMVSLCGWRHYLSYQGDSQAPHIRPDIVALSGSTGVYPFRLKTHTRTDSVILRYFTDPHGAVFSLVFSFYREVGGQGLQLRTVLIQVKIQLVDWYECSTSTLGKSWSHVLDSTSHYCHQNTKWGNIFWKNSVHPSIRVLHIWRIYATEHWSCSEGSWWNTWPIVLTISSIFRFDLGPEIKSPNEFQFDLSKSSFLILSQFLIWSKKTTNTKVRSSNDLFHYNISFQFLPVYLLSDAALKTV